MRQVVEVEAKRPSNEGFIPRTARRQVTGDEAAECQPYRQIDIRQVEGFADGSEEGDVCMIERRAAYVLW